MPQSYQLHIIRASGIHWKPDLVSLHREAPNLYVGIDIDGKRIHRSSAKRDWEGLWNDLAPLSAESQSSVIALQVFSKRSMKKDKCLAKVEMEIGVLLEKCSTQKDFPLQLDHIKENVTEKPELVVRMTAIGRTRAGAIALANATQDNETIERGAAPSAIKLVDHGAEHADLASVLKTLVARLDIIVQMGAEIAKIHPYSNAAWKVLTSVYEAIKKQEEKDEKVVQLVQTMADAYSFVEDIESLPGKIQQLEDTISALVKQTEECALFIREYTGHGFCSRLLTGILSKQTEKINDFTAAFAQLQKALDTGLGLHTAFVSTKTQDMVKGMAQSDDLQSLRPIDMNAFLRTGCLPGTRQDLLSIITNWLTTPSDAGNPGNIFWLHGVAGAGKSAIATSVSEYFGELKRLGAFLFFNRTKSSPHSVIRTIVFQLARSNSYIAAAICAAIDEDPALVDAPMKAQFEKLLLQPLKDAEKNIPGPIIVILDALDECGDADSRRGLVSILSNEFPKLPSAFRLLITSRHDSDIAVKFEVQPSITKHLLDISLPSSLKDIRLYIDNQLLEIRQQQSLDPTWPGESKTKALAAYSSGLFIWASTAMEWLLKAHNPNMILDSLLEKGRNLDELYAETLKSTGLWDNRPSEEDTQASIQDAQAALSAVVFGKVPMTDATIDALLNLGPGHSSSRIFTKLGCVLQWAPGQIVRVLHASFADYLVDRKRSGGKPWCMNLNVLECQLALGCLRILNRPEGLQFNICQIKDSHIRNTDVQDIKNYIPPHLSYSSLFWASHLLTTDFEDESTDFKSSDMKNALLADIRTLLYTKFLFWLEVLGLLQETSSAIDVLTTVGKLAKHNHDEELGDFAIDAVKFVTAFAPAIAHSVPHIYISAIPLTPRESRVAKKFSQWFVQKVDIQSSLGVHWPRFQTTIEGHNRPVRSISLSPHGERIVSGSDDSTIRVWDARTGTLVAGPFTGHSKEVRCVAFSPNGEHIVSGSRDTTLRMCDVHTGVLVAGPFKGHTNSVLSVSFSPDSRRIASGSSDCTVRVWDVHNVDLPSVFSGHTRSVWSVAFSPHGDQIVSGSTDTTIRVWDAQTGALVSLFEGHNGDVRSVAYSRDGHRIVSGSEDNSIRVWDTSTGSLVAGPITGHTDCVFSVAFSLDGEHIVSGSKDRTVCVWNTRTGTLVASPFAGHSDSVVSVSFSPDGGRIVSGSVDHTVRIWDAQLDSKADREYVKAPSYVSQTGHSSDVDSVAFSPDGNRIVSGSHDKTIRVWDAHTGSLVAGPFIGHTHAVLSVAFSPDGEHIVSGSRDSTVCIWDVRTGTQAIAPFKGGGDWIRHVSFSSDGNRIAACGDFATMSVWDAQTAVLVRGAWKRGSNVVKLSLAFSPDREHIIEGSGDGSIRVLEALTGALISGPFEGHNGKIECLASSPDGGRVVSGSSDSTVRIWDAHTGFLIPVPLQGHSRVVNSVAFSPDGKWIASGSLDRTVCVWDAQTGTVVAGPFEGPSTPVFTVTFSPDGGRVAAGSKDGTIHVYEINSNCVPHQGFGDGSTLKDGWILDSASQLILWIPPWLRKGLYFPQNSLVISRDGTTKLDFTRFVHGTSWVECIDPKVRG